MSQLAHLTAVIISCNKNSTLFCQRGGNAEESQSLFMVIGLISWCLCVINSKDTVFDWRNGAQSSLQADSWRECDCQHSCEVFKLQQQPL